MDEWVDGGSTEIEFSNVDFLKEDFLAKVEIRKDFKLYETEKKIEFSRKSLEEVRESSNRHWWSNDHQG